MYTYIFIINVNLALLLFKEKIKRLKREKHLTMFAFQDIILTEGGQNAN